MPLDEDSINFDTLNLGRPTETRVYNSIYLNAIQLFQAVTGRDRVSASHNLTDMQKEGAAYAKITQIPEIKQNGYVAKLFTFRDAVTFIRGIPYRPYKVSDTDKIAMMDILKRHPAYSMDSPVPVAIAVPVQQPRLVQPRLSSMFDPVPNPVRPSSPVPTESFNEAGLEDAGDGGMSSGGVQEEDGEEDDNLDEQEEAGVSPASQTQPQKINFNELALGKFTEVKVSYDNLIYAVDLTMVVTGKDSNHANDTLRTLSPEKFDIKNIIERPKPGNKRHPLKLVTLEHALQLVMVLPGQMSKVYRQKFADVIVRYMAGAPSLARELQQNAQSNDPINVLARSSLNKRGREEVEDGDGGACGLESGQLVPPASGQVQLVQPGSGQVQMVQSTGMDSATVLTLVQCIKDMRKEDMEMQEKNLKCIADVQEKNLQCIADMQEKNLKCLLDVQERNTQRVIEAEIKAALATALAAQKDAVKMRELKTIKAENSKLKRAAKK